MGWDLNSLPQVHVTRNAWLMALDHPISHLGQVPVAMQVPIAICVPWNIFLPSKVASFISMLSALKCTNLPCTRSGGMAAPFS